MFAPAQHCTTHFSFQKHEMDLFDDDFENQCKARWLTLCYEVALETGLTPPHFDAKKHSATDLFWVSLRLHRVDNVIAAMQKRVASLDVYASLLQNVPDDCLDALSQSSIRAAVFIGAATLHKDPDDVAGVAKRLVVGLGNAMTHHSQDDIPAHFFDFAHDLVMASKAMVVMELINMILTCCPKRAERVLFAYFLKPPWDVQLLSAAAEQAMKKQYGAGSMAANLVHVLQHGISLETKEQIMLCLRTCMFAWVRSRGDEDSMACAAIKFMQSALREVEWENVAAALETVPIGTILLLSCCHRMPIRVRQAAMEIVQQRNLAFDPAFAKNADVAAALASARWPVSIVIAPTLQLQVAQWCPFAATDLLGTNSFLNDGVDDTLFENLFRFFSPEEQRSTLHKRLCNLV